MTIIDDLLLASSLSLALFNHRSVAQQLLRAMKNQALETRDDFMKIVKQVVAKQQLDNVFTASFDKRTHNLKPKAKRRVIQTRLDKIEKKSLGPRGLRATIRKKAKPCAHGHTNSEF